MRMVAAIAIGLSLINCGDALAQVVSECKFKTCGGGTPVPHNDNGYRFETSSIVYPMNNTGRVIYQTCVENKSDRDFEFKWYIPGPDSWLLRGCALKSPRQKIKTPLTDTRAVYGTVINGFLAVRNLCLIAATFKPSGTRNKRTASRSSLKSCDTRPAI